MQRDARKYLHDIAQAADLIVSFTSGKAFADYQTDAMLRSAVERQLGIIGEALAQLVHLDATIAAKVREYRRIIAFRNILIHGYATVDDRLVWDVVQSKLQGLREDVAFLLRELGDGE